MATGTMTRTSKPWYSGWTPPKYYMFYVGFWQTQEKYDAQKANALCQKGQGPAAQEGRKES